MKFIHTAFVKAKKVFRDENGTFSVEAVLMFPVLVWAFIAMFVFFEGLRESNINLKATYTLSDLLSRTEIEIDDEYMAGMNRVYAWLSRSQNPVSLRITVVTYDEATDSHRKEWSEGVDQDGLTQEEIDEYITPQIPIMADDNIAIVVETWTTYAPIMDIGLTTTDIYNLVVTAPRFAGQLKYVGQGAGGGTEHDDGTTDPDEDTPDQNT